MDWDVFYFNSCSKITRSPQPEDDLRAVLFTVTAAQGNIRIKQQTKNQYIYIFL